MLRDIRTLPDNVSEDHPLHRVHFRLWQITMTAGTLLAAGWCFALNPIAGIIASFMAKHVLVAILAAGLTVPTPSREDSRSV